MKKLCLLLLIISSTATWAQKTTYKGFPSLIWPKLYDISFVKAEDEHGAYEKPIFTDAVKLLHNKTLSLPGYMVPFETGSKSAHFMMSSLPLNACFFCGVGGPETVIEVNLKSAVSYTDKPIEVRGVLKLNDKDPDKMIYQLDNAEVTGEVGY